MKIKCDFLATAPLLHFMTYQAKEKNSGENTCFLDLTHTKLCIHNRRSSEMTSEFEKIKVLQIIFLWNGEIKFRTQQVLSFFIWHHLVHNIWFLNSIPLAFIRQLSMLMTCNKPQRHWKKEEWKIKHEWH